MHVIIFCLIQDKYYDPDKAAQDRSLAYRRNPEAIGKALAQCGFFLIAETDFRKNSTEILNIYRHRDVVEKSFDNLKNDLDMKRLYIHSDEAVEGTSFVAFVALIVRSHMLNVLQHFMAERHFTFFSKIPLFFMPFYNNIPIFAC